MASRGRPNLRGNVKGVTLKVTPDAWEMFHQLAESMGMTRSELVEKIATSEISLSQENSLLAKSLDLPPSNEQKEHHPQKP